MSFFSGSPAEYEQVSNLTPQQLRLEKERRGAAKGAFGQAGDYWRNILSNDPSAFSAFEAPAQRQFNEQIIPDLAEQFAGMGAGNLSSSGFRNAAVGAGTDLAERLASMRAQLREGAASNLYNLGQSSLQPHAQYQQTNPGSQGFLSSFSSGLGQAIPGAAMGFLQGGPAGAATGGGLGFLKGFSNSSPYGSGTSGLQGISGAVRGAGGYG
jgi:hypothetical protein